MASALFDGPWARMSREITGKVFEVLFYEDLGALQAASLVCRNWASLCQEHLLYDVRIRGANKLDEFLRSVQNFSENARSCLAVIRLSSSGANPADAMSITRGQLALLLDSLPPDTPTLRA